MKALLVVLGALAALLVGAALVGPLLVDWNRFKPEIAALAERATGRTLAIDGDVGFSLLPTPTLSAAGVHVGNPPGAAAPDLMRLKALDARIALGPLLGGRIVVESIALVEPALVIDADASAGNGAGAGGWDAGLDAPFDGRLSFDRIIVVDGSITWRTADGTLALERLNAEVTAGALAGPFRASGDVAWLGLPWRFDLTTGRLGDAAPLGLSLGLRGGGANLRVTGTVTPGAGETLMVGRVRADTNRLPELLAASGFAGGLTGGLPAPLGQTLTLEAALQVGRARLALNEVAMTLGDDMRASGALGLTLQPRAALDVALAVNRLDVERWSTALPAPPRAGAPVPRRVVRATLDLAIDAVLWRGGVIRQARLNGVLGEAGLTVRQAGAQLPGGSDVALFGQLTFGDAPRFDGQLEGGADNLRSLFDWLKLDVGAIPPDRLRRVSVTSGVSIAADKLELANMDLQFDASRLTGSVAAALGPRPAFGANLRLDRLNLEAYLPRAASIARAGGPPSPRGAPPHEPFDWLTGFDANLQLTVDQLAYDTVPLSGVLANLTLERGTLSVHELSVESAAGVRALLGGVVHRGRWPAELALTLSAQASDPSRFLQLIGDDAATSALGPLALSLTATGPLDRLRLALDGELAGGTLGASAEIDVLAPGGSVALNVRHGEALRLARALMPLYRPAAEAVGPFELSGTLSLAAGRLGLSDGALRLGPARFVVSAGADLANPRLGATLRVTGATLVLDPLLPRRLGARPATPLAADLGALLAALPATLAALPPLDADIAVGLDELDYQRHGLSDARLELALTERGVRAFDLGGRAWDGRIGLAGTLEPALALTLTLSDVALGHAGAALLGDSGLDGRLDLAAKLAASGTTESELLTSLTGTGRVQARAGSVPGFDLDALDALLQRGTATGDTVTRAVEQDLTRGRTPFATVAGGFTLAGARVATEDLVLAGAAGTVALRGALDLAARQLDLRLALQLAADPAAPPARLHVAGPLGAPAREIDAQALIAYLVTRQARPAADGVRR